MKADADVIAKEKALKDAKRNAALVLKTALRPNVLARKKKRDAEKAKARSSAGAIRKAATAQAVPTKRAKRLAKSANAASSAAKTAKRKSDTLKTDVTRVKRKVKIADKALASAKKTKARVAKKKLPRALAALDTNLLVSQATGKRRRR